MPSKEKKAVSELAALEEVKDVPGLIVDGGISEDALQDKSIYYGAIKYQSLEGEKVDALLVDQEEDVKKAVAESKEGSGQKALASMAVFPLIMLIAYVILYFYFKSKGGYKPLDVSAAT